MNVMTTAAIHDTSVTTRARRASFSEIGAVPMTNIRKKSQLTQLRF